MESLAEQGGDVEELVAIKQRDLSSSCSYLQIAEIYRKARQGAKALEWAEKGIQTFGKESDSRLQDLLAELYHRRKRHEEAMALIWPQFERQTGLINYQKLKKHADRNKTWQEAQAGGCSKELWLWLAELREKEHPKDSIAVYRVQIGPIVEQTNNEASG